MGARQYYIHTGDMFVVAVCRDKVPVWYDVVCIVQSLPEDKYQTFQVSIKAMTGAFRVTTRERRRTALLYSIAKYALSSQQYEDFKFRFLVECGTTLEGKIKEAVERLRRYPSRYRVKIDPDMILTSLEHMKSKRELRRKK